MKEPIRVLHFQGRLGSGGMETFMMNAYRSLDRTKIQFDFLIYDDYEDVKPYNKEIQKMGGHIYVVPNPKRNIIAYIKAVRELLRDKKFEVVHNQVFFGGGINLKLAKEAGIKKRIAHSHFTSDGKGNSIPIIVLRKVFHRLLLKNATVFLACSMEAGYGLYGKKQPFTLIPNGIDLNMYQSVPESKEQVRADLSIPEDSLVVGHVGRFDEQKNHKFLVEIFKEIVNKKENSHLLLIGVGKLQDEVKEQVKKMGIEEKVTFLGLRKDIPYVLKSMDVFLMPSLYEGLPVSAVEAQAANLKLVLSTEVTRETQLSENVQFLSLEDTPQKWAFAVISEPMMNSPFIELDNYDMKHTANLLENIYLS
ncbi:glycosyltransferase family 1 protein [Carnobacterium mobile]|uniref:glycosyltransferase family 1 protein n=1 Tax=Carnobacterium mobile TaxID=2750 RepID=UPI00054CDA7B|nr:glycosyltransferase family 1 protein [Carnobacterium mobile]